MKLSEFVAILESTKLPVAYNAFRIGAVPALPYIVYSFPNSDNFGADNCVYQRYENVRVWLCTSEKDFTTEKLLESALDANTLFWDKTETFEQNDSMYMILYETEILINE